MKVLSDIEENQFSKIEETWFSIYPLIYYKLNRFKNISFKFKNKNILQFYNSLEKGVDYKQLINIFNNNFTLFDVNSKDMLNDLIELSKTFFPINYYLKDLIYELRTPYLKDSFSGTKEKDIFWRHDGWLNCYYGPLKDTEAKDYLLDKYNHLSKLEKNSISFIKLSLTLMYRFAECNKIKEAKKIGKKALKKINYVTYQEAKKDLDRLEFKEKVSKFFLIRARGFITKVQYYLNIMMFLYRSEKNPKKKKRIINKILKVSSMPKIHYNNIIVGLFQENRTKDFLLISRPQHVLRLIEIRIDKYVLNKDDQLLPEIYELIDDFLKLLKIHYYDNKFYLLNYFIIMEFYFILFYFLEKVHGIDIQEY